MIPIADCGFWIADWGMKKDSVERRVQSVEEKYKGGSLSALRYPLYANKNDIRVKDVSYVV